MSSTHIKSSASQSEGSFYPHLGGKANSGVFQAVIRELFDLEAPNIVEARGAKKICSSGSIQVEALRGIDLDVKRGEMV